MKKPIPQQAAMSHPSAACDLKKPAGIRLPFPQSQVALLRQGSAIPSSLIIAKALTRLSQKL